MPDKTCSVIFNVVLVFLMNSSTYAASFSSHASSSSSSYVQTISFNNENFDRNAQAFGNKTANLIELEKIVHHLNNISGRTVFAVPPFFGISNLEIIAYLKETAYKKTNVWDYILRQLNIFAENQRHPSVLSKDARTALAKIRKALTSVSFDIFRIVNKPDRNAQLKSFIADANRNKNLLMVRSTGREDSNELSNAGGNESVAAVHSSVDAISHAIQTVLESYAGEKSIDQRLIGKDKHLFDTLFMAVLLQVMIGEIYDISTDIPKSGVIFSPEAEGETPHVTTIQATFGHNEGVVNDLIPVDTYYIGPSNIIHPLISIKRQRLAALQDKPGLHFVENPRDIQQSSTLNPNTVLMLKDAAEFMQKYYGNPVDIEFVILGETIYFVQVRPLETKKIKSSYLSDDFVKKNSASILNISSIGIGNASVRIIERPEQIIIADTIMQAYDSFLANTKDRDYIQAVIINEYARSSSHRATQFRRLGIPVLYASELGTIKTWIEELKKTISTNSSASIIEASSYAATSSSTDPISVQTSSENIQQLLIDAQRGIIIPFIPTDTLDTARIIMRGWYNHPIAKKLSLMPEFITTIAGDQYNKIIPEEHLKKIPTSKLLELLKNVDNEIIIKAIKSILHRMYTEIKRLKQSSTQSDELLNEISQVYKAALSSAYELYTTCLNPRSNRLERLYPVTFFEALIRQLPNPMQFVRDYSFISLIKTEYQEQRIMQELGAEPGQLNAYLVQYAKIGDYALTEIQKAHWIRYVKGMAQVDPDLQKHLAKIMLDITRLHIIPLWLNSSFEKAYQTDNHAEQVTFRLLDEHEKSADFIKFLDQLQSFFSSFDASSFDLPNKFTAQWDIFKQKTDILSSQVFLNRFMDTSDTGKQAAIQVTRTAVETFDTAIKALTGSRQYKKNAVLLKTIRFREMLQEFKKMFNAWAHIPLIVDNLEKMVDKWNFRNLSDYLNRIDELLSKTTSGPEQLASSAYFNVAGAALGSMALWDRSTRGTITLEDLFTLIHQNLLVILGLISKELLEISVPENVAIVKNTIADLSINLSRDQTWIDKLFMPSTSKPQYIGLSFENNLIIYHYNIPLRNHSSTLQIRYNTLNKQILLTANFIGEARHRWATIAQLADAIAETFNLTSNSKTEVDQIRGITTFTWDISDLKKLPIVSKYIKMLTEHTLYENQNIADIIRAEDPENANAILRRYQSPQAVMGCSIL